MRPFRDVERRRPHSSIEQLASNLWRVTAPVPRMFIDRQMVIARDHRARLLIHSCITLDAPEQALVERLGEPTWLVVPNGYHRLDAAAYKRLYPRLLVVAPIGSSSRVSEVVPVDMTYEEFGDVGSIALEHAPWDAAKEGVLHVHSDDGRTLVFNDLLFVPPQDGISGAVYRALRQGPQVSWLARQLFVPDRKALRTWLLRLTEIENLRRLIPAHGEPIAANAREILAAVARRA